MYLTYQDDDACMFVKVKDQCYVKQYNITTNTSRKNIRKVPSFTNIYIYTKPCMEYKLDLAVLYVA